MNQQITESGLSRFWKHMQERDCGTITAWRTAEECNTGRKYTYREKLQRNRSLLAKIQSRGYGVTKMKGSYIEGYGTESAIEVHEDIFFVVDIKSSGNLESDLRAWGELFEQDSILFVPAGGDTALLIGTNKCQDGYPGYGNKKAFDKRSMGFEGEFFSRVSGRPWKFYNEEMAECVLPQGYFGKWGCKTIAESDWRTLEVPE